MTKAIKVENLSKAYQLGDFGTGTISRDLERFWARVRGKEDPFLKIGEVNDRTISGASDIVWSLKDINFEIEQGDAVGIIGRNGAGKSTLLKILSRVTSPTTGSIKVKGRIASLLEVGTGFHPELTGRENIYLNGAILGMRKAEIKRKFDAIVDFAGVERYIDTPVKRYSSGMYVRLAFAVAAHLESEILIVDEVLSVGDAEFQKKCLGKMGDVSKGEGRTVLFVSHNMAAINNFCIKGIILNNGSIYYSGNIENAIQCYGKLDNLNYTPNYNGNKVIKNIEALIYYHKETKAIDLELIIQISSDEIIDDVVLGIMLKDWFGSSLFAINNRHYSDYSSKFTKIKNGIFNIKLFSIPLLPGEYQISIFLGDKITDIEVLMDVIKINIDYVSQKATTFALDYNLNKISINKASWSILK